MANNPSASKFVISFLDPTARIGQEVGLKASLLAQAASHGVPVPETFILLPAPLDSTGPTANFSEEARKQMHDAIAQIEADTGKYLGSEKDPLMLATRLSCCRKQNSHPSLLNVGLPLAGSVTVGNTLLSKHALDNERRRLVQRLSGDSYMVVWKRLTSSEADQRAVALMILEEFADKHLKGPGCDPQELGFPDNGVVTIVIQLMRPSALAVGAATITVFSRDPSGKVNGPTGYVHVVNEEGRQPNYFSLHLLEKQMPYQYEKVCEYCRTIEELFGTVCRIRFGVDDGQLYALSIHRVSADPDVSCSLLVEQVRTGKRTKAEALDLAEPLWFQSGGLDKLSNPESLIPLGRGTSLGQNLVTGHLAFDYATVDTFSSRGEPVIFVSEEPKLENAEILLKAQGLISMRGGVTSHISVVAHGMGKPCVTGIEGASLFLAQREYRIGGQVLREGDWVTIDESQGLIYLGRAELVPSQHRWENQEILSWANAMRNVQVFVNADTVEEIRAGVIVGADGVGLCRSEHQLLEGSILEAFQCMLLSTDDDQRTHFMSIVMTALAEQFIRMLRELGGKPIHYRLLDAPVNEFLPRDLRSLKPLSRSLNVTETELQARISGLHEENALLGRRGCRWGFSFPDFYKHQIKLVVDSAQQVAAEGIPSDITIIVPMISMASELCQWFRVYQDAVGSARGALHLSALEFGTMVETPRAAIIASELAKYARILCLGTNDLTQTVWAISRDDFGTYFSRYQEIGLSDWDPFRTIDITGVGNLVRTAMANARQTRPDVRCYVCGEHAGQPENVRWFIENGVDGLSCTADHVGVVIVTAAQVRSAQLSPSANSGFEVPSTPRIQDYSGHVMQMLVNESGRGNKAQAMKIAYDWAHEIELEIGLEETDVWKFFKRNLTIEWFGSWEYQRFAPVWSTEEALSYSRSLSGRTVRYSLFPKGIAAQATSRVLPDGQSIDVWKAVFNALDHSVAMEVFPQQPETKLCFRAVSKNWVLRIEAGFGQAINVFWHELGSHPVIVGVLDGRTHTIAIGNQGGKESAKGSERIQAAVRRLLERHGEDILGRCQDLGSALGLEWIAIEGYYDAEAEDSPFVCDVDLPLDLAFYRH